MIRVCRFALVALLPAGLLGAGAPTSLQDCEARVRARPKELDSYRCFAVLARQGPGKEAEKALQSILARDQGNHRARLYLARIASDHGRSEAENLFRQAAEGFAAEKEAKGEMLAHIGLCALFDRRGQAAEVDAELAKAAHIAESKGDPELLVRVQLVRGSQALRKGDYAGAWRLFKETEEKVFPNGPLDLRAQCFGGLGMVAGATGRDEEAASYFRQEAELRREDGDLYELARIQAQLLTVKVRLHSKGKIPREEVVQLAEDSLSAATRGGNPQVEARAHFYLGHLGEGLSAREHNSRCLEVSRKIQDPVTEGMCLRGLADSFAKSEPRDLSQATRLSDEMVELARRTGNLHGKASAALFRAQLRARTGPHEQAVTEHLYALASIEAIRDLQQDSVARARVTSFWAIAYYNLAGYLLFSTQDSPLSPAGDLAFATVERMRARALLDELDMAQASSMFVPSGPVTERRSALLKEITQVQRRLMSPALPPPEKDAALGRLEKLEIEEASLREELARSHAGFAELRKPKLATLAELRSALRPDEAIVSFQVSVADLDDKTISRGSWVWLLTREGARVYPIPDRQVLSPAVALLLGLIERRDGAEAASSARLYKLLLEKALLGLPRTVQRLVIVPDSVLHRLPFHALRPETTAPPLAARFQISVAPSASLWLRWRRQVPALDVRNALVLADPTLPETVAKLASDREWTGGADLGSLPKARQEANTVALAMGGQSQLLVGRDATEHSLKSAAWDRFGILHIAAHSLIDDGRPERSAILLAPGAESEDGLLQIREIAGLDLRGRAVILSSCRSAAGTLVEGEGILSLARAFFQAGARTVVGGLWRLRDDDTERFVSTFYKHMSNGQSVGRALTQTRRDQIRRKAPTAAWAGLIVLGDGDFTPMPRRPIAIRAQKLSRATTGIR